MMVEWEVEVEVLKGTQLVIRHHSLMFVDYGVTEIAR